MHNQRRLFVASCFALITSAFSFQMRQDSGDDVGAYFQLTKELVGSLMGGQFLGMATSMLVFSFLCDFLGMGKVLGLAWLCHLIGFSGTIFAEYITQQGFTASIGNALASMSGGMKETLGWSLLPDAPGGQTAFWVLWLAAFVTGAANGLVEIAINPLAATLFPDQKTHKLNVLHAWWPGGLILAGLLAQFLVNPLYNKPAEFFGYTIDPNTLGLGAYIPSIPSWQMKFCLASVPLLLYGLLSIGQRFPATERVQANVSALTMFLQIFRPLFILWAIAMLLVASTELGTNSWMESILKRTANVSGTVIFIYTSMLMFVLRFFAGPLAHRFSPVGMLFFCSFLTAGGLYCLSLAGDKYTAFGAATVFGLGIAYYWPTMLGFTAERFPKGGALVLGLMGCIGNVAISQASPQIGKVYDSASVSQLPADVRTFKATGPDGQSKPLVAPGDVPSFLPPEVASFLYPAGGQKLNPEATPLLAKDSAEAKAVQNAEQYGASFVLTRIALMPCALILIYGLIAVFDKLRGGYQAEVLTTTDVDFDNARRPRPSWPKDMTR